MKFRDFTNQFTQGRIWLAVLALSLLVAPSHAQELFRVGRPDYARSHSARSPYAGSPYAGSPRVVRPEVAPTSSLTPNRSTPLPLLDPPSTLSAARPIDRFPHLAPPTTCANDAIQPDTQLDYERVQRAWNNYQREVTEYHARYGGDGQAGPWASPSTVSPWGPRNARPDAPRRPGFNVRPAGFTGSRVTPVVGGYASGGYPTGGPCSNRGCRSRGSDLAPADLPPRLSRDVPVRPYRESPVLRNEQRSFVDDGEAYFQNQAGRVQAGRAQVGSQHLASDRGRLIPVPKYRASSNSRQTFAPTSRLERSHDEMERWKAVELRDSDPRERLERLGRPPLDPRNSARRFEPVGNTEQMFTTPAPVRPIDPAKIASRARDFFRSHLAE